MASLSCRVPITLYACVAQDDFIWSTIGTREDKMRDAEYLGDGVYAKLNEINQVILFTYDGIQTTNIIYLEPELVGVLKQWLERNKL
ncbi:MAG TPA: hypothetical protein VGF75_02050 [Candidatus Saccharimonadales bacterium]|jgi:hypothetical protein